MARYDVNGKVALITGGARGIGFESARLLVGKGASVALVDVDGDEARAAAERLGASDRALGFACDVTDRDALDDIVAQVVERLGGIDIVIAGAGIAPQAQPVATIDEANWERVIEVNLLGVWRTVRATLAQITARQGHVVVIASIYAFLNGTLASPYAASKAAVESFGRSLRVELAPHGATAQVAEFGFIDTKLIRDSLAGEPLMERLVDRLPGWMATRLEPSEAAASLVAGIEKRASRSLVPAYWRPVGVLRGIVNPLVDAAMRHDRGLLDLIRESEALGRTQRERTPNG